MLGHIVGQDGNIVMLSHVMTIDHKVYDHNNLFWSRITVKMRDGSTEYLFNKSFTDKVDRDTAQAKAWKLVSTLLPQPAADFSKPIRTRKR